MFTVAIILQLILSYSSLANPIPSGVSKNVDESGDGNSTDDDNDGDITFDDLVLCVLFAVYAWFAIGLLITCCFMKCDCCCGGGECSSFEKCHCNFIPFVSPCNRNNKFLNFRQCPSPTRVTTSQQGLNFRMTGNIKNPYYDRYNMDIPYLPQRVSNDSETNEMSPSVDSDPVSRLNVAISSKNDDLDDNDLGNQNLTEV
ncbi:hypothetical protein C6P45_002811 [Maudiozyma exigua]|uniref:Uncharacterized protein n=1 Tax=Maudiozyma exigua TaxID=34358 RepID=A0A9P6VWR7_MAUEX|nr:hypothetical protein C6P45_002811 [Kazachstania exigua]